MTPLPAAYWQTPEYLARRAAERATRERLDARVCVCGRTCIVHHTYVRPGGEAAPGCARFVEAAPVAQAAE